MAGAVRYVRPKRGTPYGTGDGRSYANAWNGLDAVVWGQLNVPDESSQLFVCGVHFQRVDLGVAGSLIYGGTNFRKARRLDGLIIRGDYAPDPGCIDARAFSYQYFDRALTTAERNDLSTWNVGTNDSSNVKCPSVNLRASWCASVLRLQVHAARVQIAEDDLQNPAVAAEATGYQYAYFPNTGPRPCFAVPYNGANILYPGNECVVCDSTAGNLRVTECLVIGNGKIARAGISLNAFSADSLILVDRNDIRGFLTAVAYRGQGQTLERVWVLVERNKIRRPGFAAYDNAYVDGVLVWGDFSGIGSYARVERNQIDGVHRRGVNTARGNGVQVRRNYIHSQPLQLITYPTRQAAWISGGPVYNADETRAGELAGSAIVLGGGAGFGHKNNALGNVIYNGGLVNGIADGGEADEAMIAGNLIVTDDPETGANGALLGSAAASSGNISRNNTIVGYKRPVLIKDSPNHKNDNSILVRGVKTSTTYLNGPIPEGDFVISGAGSTGVEIGYNCYGSADANKVSHNGASVPSEDGEFMSTNPRFVKPSKLDYRLREDSPLIAAGAWKGVYLNDASDLPIISPVDIGALTRHGYMSIPKVYLDELVLPVELSLPSLPDDPPPDVTEPPPPDPEEPPPDPEEPPPEEPPPFDPDEPDFLHSFETSKTEDGYYQIQAAADNRVTLVDTARDGGKAVQLLTSGDDINVAKSGAGWERCDLGTLGVSDYAEGMEYWYAHSVFLPSNFFLPVAAKNEYVVFDFHQRGSASGNSHTNVTVGPFYRAGSHQNVFWRFRWFAGPISGTDEELFREDIFWMNEPVQKNVWYDFVYHIRWSGFENNAPLAEIWLRKGDAPFYSFVYRRTKPTLYIDNTTYIKLANYHPAAGQPSAVIHDRVMRGPNWQSVAMVPLEGVT